MSVYALEILARQKLDDLRRAADAHRRATEARAIVRATRAARRDASTADGAAPIVSPMDAVNDASGSLSATPRRT